MQDLTAPKEAVNLMRWVFLPTLNPNRSPPTMRFLPEEGVMLDAHLPQPLGSSVVGKLEADRTFKLLVLDGREDKETDGKRIKKVQ